MTKTIDDKKLKEEVVKEFNNICEECKKEDASVSQNLVLTGFKFCESCRISKTVFPVQLILLTGSAFILLITKDTDRNAIIKKDKNIIPKALKFDFKFRICFIDIINDANIHN